jgi:membrane-bound lytic murein transglycosylase A
LTRLQRGAPSSGGPLRIFGPIVHQTMATANTSATSASSKIHPIVFRVLDWSRAKARLIPWLAAALAAAGCVTAPPPPVPAPPPAPLPAIYRPVAWSTLPGWGEDRVEQAWPAFRAGCEVLIASPSRAESWRAVCAAGDDIDGRSVAAVRAFFETHFIAYQVTGADGRDTGLVTGYYEPLLAGSRTKSARYPVPIYGVPDDLLVVDLASLYPELKGMRLRGRLDGRRVIPYWTRGEIDSGRAGVYGPTLVYVDDPVDAFFLQIQGSGRIKLDDGGILRVGYADQNGQPYRSIGRVLIDRGELSLGEATLQGIRDWGRRNPDKLPALLDENPSYVFFRVVPPPLPGTLEAEIDGPYGALGVPLLRGRAIAVDPRAIPLGAPVFLATTYPLSNAPLQRLTLAQDTGGAIRGAVRADFFWGFGDEAGREAGRMRQQGRMWLLWPKGAELPRSRP